MSFPWLFLCRLNMQLTRSFDYPCNIKFINRHFVKFTKHISRCFLPDFARIFKTLCFELIGWLDLMKPLCDRLQFFCRFISVVNIISKLSCECYLTKLRQLNFSYFMNRIKMSDKVFFENVTLNVFKFWLNKLTGWFWTLEYFLFFLLKSNELFHLVSLITIILCNKLIIVAFRSPRKKPASGLYPLTYLTSDFIPVISFLDYDIGTWNAWFVSRSRMALLNVGIYS